MNFPRFMSIQSLFPLWMSQATPRKRKKTSGLLPRQCYKLRQPVAFQGSGDGANERHRIRTPFLWVFMVLDYLLI